METATQTPVAESSPAFQIPTERAAYDKWRATGEIPESQPAESTPAKETSAEGEQPEGKGAPASEAGKQKQEPKRSTAETRLNELLADLKTAGLSPAELKTYRREAPQQQKTEQPAKAAPEQTEKPVSKLEAPTKPDPKDFEGKSWQEYEAAKDKYNEEMAEYKANARLEKYVSDQKQEAAAKELQAKVDDATKRYGKDATTTINETATAIFTDAKVPEQVKSLLSDSPVLVDLLYVLGSKPEDLSDFLGSARSSAGAAIRKIVLVERLVMDELAKGSSGTEATGRGEDGKFKAPEKKTTEAPPPPKEVGGRGGSPPDEVEDAVKRNDFTAFHEAENRRELARRKGQ